MSIDGHFVAMQFSSSNVSNKIISKDSSKMAPIFLRNLTRSNDGVVVGPFVDLNRCLLEPRLVTPDGRGPS